MAKREVVLETRNLSMHFGGVRAVDNVDFELREKELRCLIGPNGAGKSTFFKCLTGQLIPTSGDVVIRDITMTGREPHAIAGLGVGIKTQVPNLFDGLSAQENLWLSARRWHGDKRATQLVKETIERLELGEIRSATVGSLAPEASVARSKLHQPAQVLIRFGRELAEHWRLFLATGG